MAYFNVWYQRPEIFGRKVQIDPNNLSLTHIQVKSLIAEDEEQVFVEMQGEVWSPNGEARDLIRGLGLHHTSMSVGDVAVDVDNNDTYVVAPFGFKLLPIVR